MGYFLIDTVEDNPWIETTELRSGNLLPFLVNELVEDSCSTKFEIELGLVDGESTVRADLYAWAEIINIGDPPPPWLPQPDPYETGDICLVLTLAPETLGDNNNFSFISHKLLANGIVLCEGSASGVPGETVVIDLYPGHTLSGQFYIRFRDASVLIDDGDDGDDGDGHIIDAPPEGP